MRSVDQSPANVNRLATRALSSFGKVGTIRIIGTNHLPQGRSQAKIMGCDQGDSEAGHRDDGNDLSMVAAAVTSTPAFETTVHAARLDTTRSGDAAYPGGLSVATFDPSYS
jgi:hypothetical protein